MIEFSISPVTFAASVWKSRDLIYVLSKREVLGRYRGSVLGLFWSLFHPIAMLLVYTFVFSVVFKARWSGGGDSKTEFALVLFAGLTVYSLFSECVTRAPSLILNNTSYVKKIIFPLEILPIVAFCSALFHAGISLLVWLLFYIVVFGAPHATIVLLPIVLLPLVLITLGASWFLASFGTYVRDTSQIISVVVPMLMFLTPIFYPMSALPEEIRGLLLLNPIAVVIEQARDVLIWGKNPDWKSIGMLTAMATFAAWLGFAFFQKTRKGFGDVL